VIAMNRHDPPGHALVRPRGGGRGRHGAVAAMMLDRSPARQDRRSAASQRQRRYRRRARAGRVVVSIEVTEAVVELLIAAQWLQERAAADRAAIASAVERMLADAAR
jgi:hypothetical protein